MKTLYLIEPKEEDGETGIDPSGASEDILPPSIVKSKDCGSENGNDVGEEAPRDVRIQFANSKKNVHTNHI